MAKQSTSTPASETVRKSQQKNEDAGGGRFPTMTLSPEEMVLWERIVGQDDGPTRGRAKRTLMRAMEALDKGNDLTQKDVLDWIRRHTK
jgi:hypothetical protein